MIRTSPVTYYRAAGAVLAAAVLSLSAHRAAAQQTVDLLGGTLSGTNTVSATSSTLSTGNSGTVNNFGPGYSGTATSLVGVASTVSESFAPFGASNSFSIALSGLASLGGSTSATKTFTGVSLTPGATYNLTLTRSSAFSAGVLSSFNVAVTQGGTTVANTGSGVGLLGAVDLLSIFSTNTTTTLQFTVPSNATGNLGVAFTSSTAVGATNGTDTFTGATLTQVPEPRTGYALLIGASGLALLRFRRRLRMA